MIRPALIGLGGLTLAATLLKLVGLGPPAPERLAPEPLALPGYRLTPLAGAPAKGGREISRGPLRRWRLQPEAGGPPLALTLLPLRARNSETMQLAAFARLEPSLDLRQRQLSVAEGSRESPPPPLQLAYGRGPADPAGSLTRLQTCLTPSGQAGVGEITLGLQLQAERDAELAQHPLRTRLLRISGLRPNTRWECLAVQLATAPGPGSGARLRAAWEALSARLQVH